jgi:hypothetical protein
LGQFESTNQERVESFFPEIKYIVKGGKKLGIKIPIPRYAGKGGRGSQELNCKGHNSNLILSTV